MTETVANLPWPQNFRDKRAEELVKILTKFVKIDPDATVIDVGAGYGEIAAKLVCATNCRVICIDPYAVLSKKVAASDAGKRIFWIPSDATKKIDSIESNSAGLVMGIYFLQVLGAEEKLLAMEEMKRITQGDIVIIDELPRGIWSFVDNIIHHGLNLFGKGRYEIYEESKWNDLFKKVGLGVIKTDKFARNSIIYVLRK